MASTDRAYQGAPVVGGADGGRSMRYACSGSCSGVPFDVEGSTRSVGFGTFGVSKLTCYLYCDAWQGERGAHSCTRHSRDQDVKST
jgi:hypothetical protein